MQEIILNVKGMMCEGCENRIKNALSNTEGIKNIVANHKEGTVTITAVNIDIDKVKEKIEDMGFEV